MQSARGTHILDAWESESRLNRKAFVGDSK